MAHTSDTPKNESPDKASLPKPMMKFWQRIKNHISLKMPAKVALVLLALVLLIVLWKRAIVYIEAGEGGVLYRPFDGGVVTDHILTEGIHFLFPLNYAAIYDTRVQIIRHEFDVLTNRGLPVTLKVAVRYRPIFELLGVLHQKVGPDYPNRIILPQIESVLRKGLGNHTPEEIYTNKGMLLSKLIARAIEEVGRKFVIVDDIVIRSVSLPSGVRTAIEEKLVEEQHFLAYTFKLKAEQQEAERKRIEAAGIQDYAEKINATMSDRVLRWHGIQATKDLASSDNAKVVIIGGQKDGLPLMLNAGDWADNSEPERQDKQ
ncbi:prohibitin family protein [Pseudoalteromonas rubra]|uniref:prohibitin family protein n=1 Tax=Pseudoalteromonas rubra TaxID=43658 RepID=UPI000697A52A|nr:prohibitin family protein [Pseudoalteromonas rubra]